MKIIPLVPRGYCKGVLRAIQIAKNTALQYPNTPITILGPIVHNHYVSKALQSLGIQTLMDKGKTRYDLLDEIDEGVVIFSAHGVSEYVEQKAKQKGLIVVDASCEDVKLTKQKVMDHIANGYTIFYIGKHQHPESEGVCFKHPEVIVIETKEDIPQLDIDTKIVVTTQTTMSTTMVKSMVEAIKSRYPHALIEPQICFATSSRQNAVLNMDDTIDGMIIVGDTTSNNTTKLEQLAKSKDHVHTVVKINDLSELDPSLFDHCHAIGITSGASTPNSITDSVIAFMNAYAIDPTVSKSNYYPTHIL